MIYFVIPAYNEEENLPALLDSLAGWAGRRRADCHVVVVDDGSRDGTAAVAERFQGLPLTLVRHPVNLNVHRVFDSGFRAVLERGPDERDLVVSLEADNTSSLAILDRMIEQAGTHDLVLASCYAPGGGVEGTNFYRRLLSGCANLLLRLSPGMPRVHTFSSFYRVYRAGLLRRCYEAYGGRLFELEGFVCVVELLLKANRLRARIAEVPMVLDCSARKGKSKMKTLKTIRGYFRLFRMAVAGQLARPLPPGADRPSAPPPGGESAR